MADTTLWSPSHPHTAAEMLTRARNEPAYAAFWLLRVGFVVLPLWMGIDKFTKVLNADWPGYLAPWIVDLLPFSAQTAMYVVGAIEILAGIMVALKPRYASYVVALWLAGIIINLALLGGYWDILMRDVALFLLALTFARLARAFPAGATSDWLASIARHRRLVR